MKTLLVTCYQNNLRNLKLYLLQICSLQNLINFEEIFVYIGNFFIDEIHSIQNPCLLYENKR